MIESYDITYGKPRKAEKIDRWEKDTQPVSLSILSNQLAACLSEIQKIAKNGIFKNSELSKTYIWAIDENNKVCVSVEEIAVDAKYGAPYSGYPRRRGYRHPSEEKKLGHPTLVKGGPVRIAGELFLDEDVSSNNLKWFINAHSGRYCRQIPPTSTQLDNAANLFRSFGLNVEVDYE